MYRNRDSGQCRGINRQKKGKSAVRKKLGKDHLQAVLAIDAGWKRQKLMRPFSNAAVQLMEKGKRCKSIACIRRPRQCMDPPIRSGPFPGGHGKQFSPMRDRVQQEILSYLSAEK